MVARTWVIDLDGVIWNGADAVPGSADAVARLRRRGDRVVFATNHSSPTRAALLRQLATHGIAAAGEQLRSSADAVASLVSPGERVHAFAGDGVREALARRGAAVASGGSVDAVVVGWHEAFALTGLTTAVRHVLNGARLLATNDDRLRPSALGSQPGAGAMVAAVEAATSRRATTAGKPHPPMAAVLEPLLVGEVTVVGDSPATDGQLARVLGARFALVLSGVTATPHGAGADDLVAADLSAVVTELVA